MGKYNAMSFPQLRASFFYIGNEAWRIRKPPYFKTPKIIANSSLCSISRPKLAQSKGK